MTTGTTHRPHRPSPSTDEQGFTPDELALILRDASRRQESRAVASLDEALETARELGIDERHVLAAAAAHREKRARRAILHAHAVRERNKLGHLAWSAALFAAIVTVAASWNVAQLALVGFGIAAIAQAFRWLRAEISERTFER